LTPIAAIWIQIQSMKHLVPDLFKPSIVIFDILALWRSGWASECQDVKNYKWRLNPVLHWIICSCTHTTTVGVKGLSQRYQSSRQTNRRTPVAWCLRYADARLIVCYGVCWCGVSSADDAVEAVKRGASGVVVSNHGGRQLDTVPAPVRVHTCLLVCRIWLFTGHSKVVDEGCCNV